MKKEAIYGYFGQHDKDQRWNGLGRFDWTQDYLYEGEYCDNNINGYGRQILKSGDVYEGLWKNA